MMGDDILDTTLELATSYLDRLRDRHVGPVAAAADLRATLGGPVPEEPADPAAVVRALARAVEPGLVATAGPRYFGFVNGGVLPAALAADWLTSVWDQNAALHVMSPAAAVVESIVAEWVLDLLDLPRSASVGVATGTQMATFTALAAARHAVLQRAGWNVEAYGLMQAPPVHVVVSEEAHATIFTALRFLGLGTERARRVATDENGRMRADALRTVLDDCVGPTIVCAQAGNVNTGAADPLRDIAALTRTRAAWLHVDGAFGLWAAASPRLRAQVDGVAEADSWATDAHKWLNTPYDGGFAIVADPAAHRAAMSVHAAYLAPGAAGERDGMAWVPDASRRARAFAIYAALRSLGRSGLQVMIERCCDLARRMASRLRAAAGVEILNDVVLNQLLVRFAAPGVEPDAETTRVIERVQRDGTCWVGGTNWKGRAAMRISICNWSTTTEDIDRSADAILRAAREPS
jgi:glutamate/tyrosine decarboxylase-like PLP-dependent enzyme